MQIKAFKIKKYGAFLIAAFIPTILFFFGLMSYGLSWAFIFFFAGAVLSMVIGSILISHPLLSMLEGSGILCITIDSTGVMRPFLAQVRAPYIRAKLPGGKTIFTVFDRNTIHYLTNPLKAIARIKSGEETSEKTGEKTGEETLVLELPRKDYVKSLFAWGAFPVLIFNSVLGEFYTKEMFCKLETETFVQHLVLYLNRKIDELSNNMRDFARYVVEQTKPKINFFQSKFFWIIIIVVILVLALLFAPQLMKTFGSVQLPSLPSQPINPIGG